MSERLFYINESSWSKPWLLLLLLQSDTQNILINSSSFHPNMVAPTEFPVAELISLTEAAGIIATLFVIFYFSRKEMRNVSTDIETKVLNDLDEKIHAMGEMMVHRPDLIKLLNKKQTNQSPELVCAYYILYMCSHAFHMRQRNVLSNNEWAGWLQQMKTTFEEGELHDYQKNNIQPNKWFDPAFTEFINKVVIKNKR